MFLSTIQTLPFEGHNVAYQCKGHNVAYQCKGHNVAYQCKGNNVCEYEVNWLTNEKVIRGKRNYNTNC